MSIADNLAHLHQQIADACRRANRPESDVALMAVSKVHPFDVILEAYAAGQRLFGENRVQEFAEKSSHLTHLSHPPQKNPPSTQHHPATQSDPPSAQDSAEFHLIGPLQSNKSTRAAELFDAIDTVDSLKIAQRLNLAAAALHKKLPICIEVKLSHEESKHGIAPEELPALLQSIAPLENLILSGLMTVPPWSEEPETARPYFQQLRRLRDQQQRLHPTLTQLSIGMSNDFEVAIEEGSTCIRVGTALFGRRIHPPQS